MKKIKIYHLITTLLITNTECRVYESKLSNITMKYDYTRKRIIINNNFIISVDSTWITGVTPSIEWTGTSRFYTHINAERKIPELKNVFITK